MCVPHQNKSIGLYRESRREKKKPSSKSYLTKDELRAGDPDFVDERTSEYIPKDKRSILDKILDWLVD